MSDIANPSEITRDSKVSNVRCALNSDQYSNGQPQWRHYMLITPTTIAHIRMEAGLIPGCYYLAWAATEPTSQGWGDMTIDEILIWKGREHGSSFCDILTIDRLMMTLRRKYPDVAEAIEAGLEGNG